MVWTGPNPLAALAAAWTGANGAPPLPRPPRRRHRPRRPRRLLPRRTRLRRRADAATAPFVYAGAQIIDPAALAGFDAEAFSLNPVWDALLARGRLRGIVHRGGWADVGRPEGIALAEAELAR